TLAGASLDVRRPFLIQFHWEIYSGHMAQTITQGIDLQVRSGQFLYRRDGLLCALLMAACLLLAHPFVEMGIVDDWSYIKTTQVFVQTGHFAYNGWATVSLGWQVLWGALFSKLFG